MSIYIIILVILIVLYNFYSKYKNLNQLIFTIILLLLLLLLNFTSNKIESYEIPTELGKINPFPVSTLGDIIQNFPTDSPNKCTINSNTKDRSGMCNYLSYNNNNRNKISNTKDRSGMCNYLSYNNNNRNKISNNNITNFKYNLAATFYNRMGDGDITRAHLLNPMNGTSLFVNCNPVYNKTNYKFAQTLEDINYVYVSPGFKVSLIARFTHIDSKNAAFNIGDPSGWYKKERRYIYGFGDPAKGGAVTIYYASKRRTDSEFMYYVQIDKSSIVKKKFVKIPKNIMNSDALNNSPINQLDRLKSIILQPTNAKDTYNLYNDNNRYQFNTGTYIPIYKQISQSSTTEVTNLLPQITTPTFMISQLPFKIETYNKRYSPNIKGLYIGKSDYKMNNHFVKDIKYNHNHKFIHILELTKINNKPLWWGQNHHFDSKMKNLFVILIIDKPAPTWGNIRKRDKYIRVLSEIDWDFDLSIPYFDETDSYTPPFIEPNTIYTINSRKYYMPPTYYSVIPIDFSSIRSIEKFTSNPTSSFYKLNEWVCVGIDKDNKKIPIVAKPQGELFKGHINQTDQDISHGTLPIKQVGEYWSDNIDQIIVEYLYPEQSHELKNINRHLYFRPSYEMMSDSKNITYNKHTIEINNINSKISSLRPWVYIKFDKPIIIESIEIEFNDTSQSNEQYKCVWGFLNNDNGSENNKCNQVFIPDNNFAILTPSPSPNKISSNQLKQIDNNNDLTIQESWYGHPDKHDLRTDVLIQIIELINKKKDFVVSNIYFGDPIVGIVKKLFIKYSINNITKQLYINENEVFRISDLFQSSYNDYCYLDRYSSLNSNETTNSNEGALKKHWDTDDPAKLENNSSCSNVIIDNNSNVINDPSGNRIYGYNYFVFEYMQSDILKDITVSMNIKTIKMNVTKSPYDLRHHNDNDKNDKIDKIVVKSNSHIIETNYNTNTLVTNLMNNTKYYEFIDKSIDLTDMNAIELTNMTDSINNTTPIILDTSILLDSMVSFGIYIEYSFVQNRTILKQDVPNTIQNKLIILAASDNSPILSIDMSDYSLYWLTERISVDVDTLDVNTPYSELRNYSTYNWKTKTRNILINNNPNTQLSIIHDGHIKSVDNNKNINVKYIGGNIGEINCGNLIIKQLQISPFDNIQQPSTTTNIPIPQLE